MPEMFKKPVSEARVTTHLSVICHVRDVPDRRQTPPTVMHLCLTDLRGHALAEYLGDRRGRLALVGRSVGRRASRRQDQGQRQRQRTAYESGGWLPRCG